MRNSILLAVIFLVGTAHAALADSFVGMLVNTSSIAGSTGAIDFMFNPGAGTTQAATLKILNFAGGTFAGLQQDFGAVSGGPVPSSITLTNTDADNEDLESFTFGNSIFLTLDFGGPAVNSPNGTATSPNVFAFSLFSDTAGTVPVLTSDANGIAALVTVNDDGSLSKRAVSSNVTFVPEPDSLWLLSSAVFVLGAGHVLRRRRAN